MNRMFLTTYDGPAQQGRLLCVFVSALRAIIALDEDRGGGAGCLVVLDAPLKVEVKETMDQVLALFDKATRCPS